MTGRAVSNRCWEGGLGRFRHDVGSTSFEGAISGNRDEVAMLGSRSEIHARGLELRLPLSSRPGAPAFWFAFGVVGWG